MSNIVIVESPAKAKTIEKYLGPDEEGNDQYKFGKSHWFNYKGLTFIENNTPW